MLLTIMYHKTIIKSGYYWSTDGQDTENKRLYLHKYKCKPI